MTAQVILGVDPGSRETGFCLVDRTGAVRGSELFRRRDDQTIIDYALDVSALAALHASDADLVGVENLGRPSPHLGMTNPKHQIDTGIVIGAITRGLWVIEAPMVMVPPGGHGSGPLAGYPAELVGAKEKKGTGKLRHVRSAYDVAMAALTYHAIQKSETTNKGAN